MRLTQPFRWWQPAMLGLLLFPATATGQTLDSVTRSQSLEPSDFPRKVVLIGEPPDGVTDEEWAAETETAIASWNSVVCSSATLSLDLSATSRPESSTAIAFVDPDDEPCFVNPGDIGWTLLAPCGEWRPTDVLLNRERFEWSRSPSPYQSETSVVDLASVITHELGHSLGLHHDDVEDPLATMAPRYLLDGGLASLSAQDKLALCALYPVSRSECATNADCAGDCVEGPHGKVCDELRMPVGSYCDLGQLECASCLVTSSSTFTGYCSAMCADDEACGGELVCDDGWCRYPFVAAETGCSTSPVRAPSVWMFGLVCLFWRRATRSSRS